MVLREFALFAGAGGGILGGHMLGWKTVAACEIEDYPRAILLQRQLDGILPRFPVWDDIRTLDGKIWRRKIDIITGGFPCQDISAAGKGAGIDGERSGLWSEMLRVVCEVRPIFVFVENSSMLTSRGLYRVLGDLAEIGYNAEWLVLGADDVGAPHRRKRIWILAYSNESRGNKDTGDCELWTDKLKQSSENKGITTTREERKITWWNTDPADICDTAEQGFPNGRISQMGESRKIEKSERPNSSQTDIPNSRQEYDQRNAGKLSEDPPKRTTSTIHDKSGSERFRGKEEISHTDKNRCNQGRGCIAKTGSNGADGDYYEFPRINKRKPKGAKIPTQPKLGRVAHGVANKINHLKAIGNGQVSAVAAIAFLILYNRITRG